VLIGAGAVAAVAAVAVVLAVLLPGGGSSDDSGPSEATPYSFSGSGYQDVVATQPDTGTGEVLIASTAADTQPRAISATEAGVDGQDASFGTGIAGGDFNGDGKADLAIGTPSLNVVSVLYGNGEGGIAHKLTITGKEGSRYGLALLARDLNDDDYSDLVVGIPGSGEDRGSIDILLGGGKDLATQRALHLRPPRGLIGDFGAVLRSGDLNGDEHVDLVEGASGTSSHLSYCLGHAKGPPTSCEELEAPDGDTETNGLAVADLDNDGKDDIVQSDTTLGGDAHGGGLRIWKGAGDAPEGTPHNFPAADVTDDPAFGKKASEFGFSVDAGVLPDDDEYADIVVGAPGYEKESGAVVVIRGGPETIARNHPDPIAGTGFRFGADVALLRLESSDTPNLVIVAEDAGFGTAVQYVDSDGGLHPITGFAGLVSKGADSNGLRIAHNAGAD